MDTKKITNNLEIIKIKLSNLNIKGGDAMQLADIFIGIDQTIQMINAPSEQEVTND